MKDIEDLKKQFIDSKKEHVLYLSERIVNRFGCSEKAGDYAEKYFLKNYFNPLNLKFRKIKKSKNRKTPEGWIIQNNKKIALAEVKLIKYKELKTDEVQMIKTRMTIVWAINKGIEQLKSIETNLPKIIYLLGDNTFLDEKSVLYGILGPLILVMNNGKRRYCGPKGFIEEKFNLFKDNLLSAVICYFCTTKGYDVYLYKNSAAKDLPQELIDKNHLRVFYNYSDSGVEKMKI